MASQPDITRVLLSKAAAGFFGLGTVATGWTIALHCSNFGHHLSQTQLDLFSWSGPIVALAEATLFLGMCVFWGTCDQSSNRSHRVWFFILLMGGALPYYFVVYLPAFRRRLKEDDTNCATSGPTSGVPVAKWKW